MKNKTIEFFIIFLCVNMLFYLAISFYHVTFTPFYWSEPGRFIMSMMFIVSPLTTKLVIASKDL